MLRSLSPIKELQWASNSSGKQSFSSFFHYFLLHINSVWSLNMNRIPNWRIRLLAFVTVHFSGWALCHALLFSLYLWLRIAFSLLSWSFKANCVSKQLWIRVKSLYQSYYDFEYRLLCCSIQFLRTLSAVVQGGPFSNNPFVDAGTKFMYIIMKVVLINHISKVNPHVCLHFLTMVTAS